jgi:RNA-directed DNA polymerase
MPCTARSRDQPRHAAIVALWRAIRYQDSYVWQADLSSCLEHLDQQTLLKKLNASSIVRQALKNWLRAGLVSLETPSGTDGASLSALLVQIALHDLDTVLRQAFTGDRSTPALVRYAGEIVVLHPTEAGLAKAQAALESWLQDNGLDSLADSAICTHTLQTYQGNVGLHFAGWDVRQYPTARTQRVGARRTPAFETVIRPARSQVRLHMDELRRVIVRHQAASQETLLADLNPLISAWSARYGTVFGGETLRACDRLLWKLLWNWTRKRHPNKGAQWRYARYWLPTAKGSQVFMTTRGLALLRHSSARSRASTSVPRPASFVEDSVPCLDRAKERGITLLPRQNMTRSNLLNSRSIRLERRSK